jgi:hypothetical protein
MIDENVTVVHTSKELFKYKLYKFIRIEFGGDRRLPLCVMHVSKPDCEDWKSVLIGKYSKYDGPTPVHTYYPRLEDFIPACEMINDYDNYVFTVSELVPILKALSECIERQIVKTEIIEENGIVYL